MVIMKYFDKTNFVPSTMDQKQKRQSLIVSLLLIIFFVITSFLFMNMLYAFTDIVGSIVSGSVDVAIKDLLRTLPLFLVFFMGLWTLLLLQATFRKVNEEKWLKSLKKDAICILAFALVNIIYVIVGLISGQYLSIAEGSPTKLFPLDTIIYSIIFILIGVFVLLYAYKYKDSYPYLVESRGNIVTKARGAYCTFVTFWLLFALFGLSSSLYSLFIYDFAHGYAFFGTIVILCYLLSPILIGIWEFYYNELKEEKKKEFLLPLGICSTSVSLICVILYFVSLSTGMDAPANAGFGMFPIAFAASVNIATLLAVLTPLIVSIVALIKGLILRKK